MNPDAHLLFNRADELPHCFGSFCFSKKTSVIGAAALVNSCGMIRQNSLHSQLGRNEPTKERKKSRITISRNCGFTKWSFLSGTICQKHHQIFLGGHWNEKLRYGPVVCIQERRALTKVPCGPKRKEHLHKLWQLFSKSYFMICFITVMCKRRKATTMAGSPTKRRWGWLKIVLMGEGRWLICKFAHILFSPNHLQTQKSSKSSNKKKGANAGGKNVSWDLGSDYKLDNLLATQKDGSN